MRRHSSMVVERLSMMVLVLVLAVPLAVSAGDLESPAGPDDQNSAMPTLSDVCDRLATGADYTLRSTFSEPTSGPTAGTGCTLQDVMDAAPSADNATGASPGDVLLGTTFWGLRTDGSWGLQTGTMPIVGQENFTPGLSAQPISEGYHDGTGAVAGDGDLVPANIVSGVDLFSVAGSAIEASGAATDGQVLTGVTYSNASGASTGTMPNVGQENFTPGVSAQLISEGYHDGTGAVAGDGDLIPGNIRGGTDLFGVTGTLYAPVEKTGQTTSYAAGDDGALRRGVAWPNPRFTDNSDGTVTDNLTGLIWLKNANCFGTRTWTTALADANGLADGACGLNDSSVAGDWRLPNVKELQSLICFRYSNPPLSNAAGTGKWSEGNAFTGVVAGWYYWSSTTLVTDSSRAWYVRLNYGLVDYDGKATSYYVWPVRGGQ